MEKIRCKNQVRNEEWLQRFEEERIVLHTVKRRKDNWIGHILFRNFCLKQFVEGDVVERSNLTGRRGRRPKRLP